MIRQLILIVGVVLVAGCGTPVPPGPSAPPGAATASTTPAQVPSPTTVSVPSIGARSSLIPLGLTPEGALEVPPVTQPQLAGWFAGPDAERDGDEVKPGEVGPAVIAGHRDGVINGEKGRPGIFFRLQHVQVGDSVLIDREDGSRLRFVVERVEEFSKDRFPREVYGDVARPALRLVTCSGMFAGGSYLNNLIVWAVLAP